MTTETETIEELKLRIEELEGQNSFECQCVSERDEKLQRIKKKIVVDLYPKLLNCAPIQRDLLDILFIIEE